MRIALLATRLPSGEMHGRKAVLRTMLDTLGDLGHEVDIILFSRREEWERPSGFHGRIQRVSTPTILGIGMSILRRFVLDRWSLNECLYWSERAARVVAATLEKWRPDLVIADMMRTAPYAAASGRPYLVDLDDLLSRRYESMAGMSREVSGILGYYADNMHPAVSTLGEWVARRVLRAESRRAAHREVEHARKASGVALVSSEEARALTQLSGRPVAVLPMSVPVHPTAPVVDKRPMSLAFVGGLTLTGNLTALRWFRDHVSPRLGEVVGNPVLNVIGNAPDHLRREFPPERFRFLGYVPDLLAELGKHQVLLAPIRGGTGIKTKILEAMAIGVPVVASVDGVTGLDVANRRECFIAEHPNEWLETLRAIEFMPHEAAAVGARGRAYVQREFRPEVIRERWSALLARILLSNGGVLYR